MKNFNINCNKFCSAVKLKLLSLNDFIISVSSHRFGVLQEDVETRRNSHPIGRGWRKSHWRHQLVERFSRFWNERNSTSIVLFLNFFFSKFTCIFLFVKKLNYYFYSCNTSIPFFLSQIDFSIKDCFVYKLLEYIWV